jgi:hypothetical protein
MIRIRQCAPWSLVAVVSSLLKASESESNSHELFPIHMVPSKEAYDIFSRDGDQLHIKFDSRTRNPRWVTERLSRQRVSNEDTNMITKRPSFYSERKIDQDSFRVCDYHPPKATQCLIINRSELLITKAPCMTRVTSPRLPTSSALRSSTIL